MFTLSKTLLRKTLLIIHSTIFLIAKSIPTILFQNSTLP
ncbi:hypothetical protein EMIT0210MI2_12909 [Priestia megaterium]